MNSINYSPITVASVPSPTAEYSDSSFSARGKDVERVASTGITYEGKCIIESENQKTTQIMEGRAMNSAFLPRNPQTSLVKEMFARKKAADASKID